ncbi:MAG: hypothetical protein M1314_02440 [Firmicutes bacterium]|nr:hypothetical protein [Bacillota bacterium]
MDREEIDERMKAVLTPEFDALRKALYASVRAAQPSEELVIETSPILVDAVEGLYVAFKPYRMNDPFDFCDHCISTQDVARLRATPLRALNHDDLWMVATNITLTIGDDRDFRYFLPRLVEGLVENALYDAEIVFGRFAGLGYYDWPHAERQAVERYLWAQFQTSLSHNPRHSGIGAIDRLVCCIGLMPIPLSPFLEAWLGRTDDFSRRNLVEYLHDDVSIEADKLVGAFWSSAGSRQVLDWLHRPETAAYAKASYECFPFENSAADSEMRRRLEAMARASAPD